VGDEIPCALSNRIAGGIEALGDIGAQGGLAGVSVTYDP